MTAWVKRVISGERQPLPLPPSKPTIFVATGQKRRWGDMPCQGWRCHQARLRQKCPMSTRTVTPLRQRVIKRIGFEHLWPSVPICSTSLYIFIDAIVLHTIPSRPHLQGKPASVNALEMAATNSGRERMDCAVRSKPATVKSGTASMRRAAATRASLSFPRRTVEASCMAYRRLPM